MTGMNWSRESCKRRLLRADLTGAMADVSSDACSSVPRSMISAWSTCRILTSRLARIAIAFVVQTSRSSGNPSPETDEYGAVPVASDLAVEVVSPSNTFNEILRKVREYLDTGSALVWVAEPQRRQVTVYTPYNMARIYRDGDTLSGGNIIQSFELDVTDIFDGRQASR